ncbi:hypothetical protein [Azospirillum endophyticum]
MAATSVRLQFDISSQDLAHRSNSLYDQQMGAYLAALRKHVAEQDLGGRLAEKVRENCLAYAIKPAWKIGSAGGRETGRGDAGSR